MTTKEILTILKTREEVAKKNGNTAELSLISELLKMANELKELKKEPK